MPPVSAPRPRRARGRVAVLLLIAAVAALAEPLLHASPAPGGPHAIAATASPPGVTYGETVDVKGDVTASGAAVSGARLALQANSYPFHGFHTIGVTASDAGGDFAFTGVRPNRNTELRVVETDGRSATSATSFVIVSPAAAVAAHDLGPGAAQLTLTVRHTPSGGPDPVSAYWYLAPRGAPAFHLEAVTRTIDRGDVTTSLAVVNPPAARFTFKVCFSPRWKHAMGTSGSYTSCSGDSGLSLVGQGSGQPAAPFPDSAAVRAAADFLNRRAGVTSFAVVNDLGQLSGVRVHERIESASVVKVMMLVSYLQRLSAEHRGIDAQSNAILYPMIHISDNDAATDVFDAIGGYPALERIARKAGMSDFVPGVGWWAYTQTSAADQARFFYQLDGLVPAQFLGYALNLLATIEPSQSWGVPPVARPSWAIFYKTGALPSQGLFNEAARLERNGVMFALCVLTTGDPSMGYGEDTIEGVGADLLSG